MMMARKANGRLYDDTVVVGFFQRDCEDEDNSKEDVGVVFVDDVAGKQLKNTIEEILIWVI
jgi:hypothetical protein